MLEELDKLMGNYDKDSALFANYWYDEGQEEASEILKKFTENDWNNLISSLSIKSNIWKKRFVYCLDDINNPYHLKTLLALVNTEDEELFSVVISFLNKFNLENVVEKQEIIDRVNKLLSITNSKVSQIVYNKFLEKQGRLK